METNILKSLDIISRGTEQVQSIELLGSRLQKAIKNKKPLIVKLGVDPTAPDIHLGHTVPFRKLRHFQDLGHQICFLIGDFTGRIGDPSGRNKTRPPLSEEEIQKNANTYLQQVGKILDTTKIQVVYNSTWLDELKFSDLIKMAAQVTVSHMLEHNTFRQRLEQSQSIRIHEMLYPFMQGYDSVALNSDVEIGGSDQTFNLLFGRDMQKNYGQEPQICITMPILTGTDGVQKMSKSLGNYIGINEPPSVIFDKIMRMTDNNIVNYFTLLTNVPGDDIIEIQERLGTKSETSYILQCKKKLAYEIVCMYYGNEPALQAYQSYGSNLKKGLPELSLSNAGVFELIDWMISSMGIPSKNEAKRLMKHGAVKINEHKIFDNPTISGILIGDIIKIGKFKSFKVIE